MLPRRDSKPTDAPALLPMFGGTEKKPRLLDREVITMGRARGSDFCLDGNEVSALHCIIFRAIDGFRVRDCGSRTGTRVNGQGVKNALLGNGDVLQIGPFSFEVRIPKDLETSPAADPVRVERLNRSRSHLAQLALRFRKKLHKSKPIQNGAAPAKNGAAPAEANSIDKKAAELKAKIKQYDQKVNQLEESEKELFEEKEALKKLEREFEDKAKAREAEVLERGKSLENEFQQRWDALQAELQAFKSAAPAVAGADPEQLQELQDLRAQKQELDALEKKLKARDKELNDDYKEILRERDQVEKSKQQWEREQSDARTQFEQQRQTIAGAELTLNDQKNQLGTMIDQLKKMQDDLRSVAHGESAQLQQQIAHLKTELAAAHSQKGNATLHLAEIQQLRDSLAAADAEIATLSQTLQQTNGLNSEVEALQREMMESQAGLHNAMKALQVENGRLRADAAQSPDRPDGAASDLHSIQLRDENDALRKLAEELQQRFADSDDPGFSYDEMTALKNEIEALRSQLTKAELAVTRKAAPDAAGDEILAENKVLRRLLDEAEGDLKRFKSASGASPEAAAREAEQLRSENGILHALLLEKEKMMEELPGIAAGKHEASPAEVEALQSELQGLRDALREKESLIDELKQESERIPGGDPETYEAELNRFRKELELDRGRLNKEISSLRQRNQELDDATRELEMELSRERAEMARERIRLDRMRDEVKADMERLQREQEVRGNLGPVQKLREELQKNAAGPPKTAADRLRTMSKLP